VADYEEFTSTAEDTSASNGRRGRRRGIDVFGLIAGLAALLVSAHVLTDGAFPPEGLSGRWVLVGAVGLIGVGMLLASLRRKS
jgi:hypothetical protein